MEAAPNPWGDLHQDLLGRIYARLTSIGDRACFVGVCNHWRFVMEQQEAAQPLLPWLLRPSAAGASYFILFSGDITEQPAIPDNALRARFCGALPGAWFVVARHQWRGYALLNLRTGEQVPLPDGVREHQIPYALRGGAHPGRGLVILAATISAAPTPHGHYIVAAISSGQSKIAFWVPGMARWSPGLDEGPEEDEEDQAFWRRVTQEMNYEDVVYYSCVQQQGFFFLTTEDHLVVFRPEYNFAEEELSMDCLIYKMPSTETTLPEDDRVVAGRYLVESAGRLMMIKRFISPGHGTVSFQVFRLQWRNQNPYWHGSATATVLTGQVIFLGRGCSRAFQTGRRYPGFIYFLDDTEGIRDVWSIVRAEKRYRCSDTGWCSYFPEPQYIEKRWPQGPVPDCSPWIWLFH